MPLDTGEVTSLSFRTDPDPDPAVVESYMPTVDAGPNIGAALKMAREFRGLTLQEVADYTRIRRAYLAAVEDMRLDQLPSRPFTIGYVRAYADALGLDGEAAVERFKSDGPKPDTALRAPIGVRQEKDPRLTLIIAAGAMVIGAIVLWNVAQRAMNAQAPPPPTAPDTVAAAPAATGRPVALGAPLPAPVESTTPTPYETPGLAAATAAGGSSDAVDDASEAAAAAKRNAPPEAPTEPLPPVFKPNGPIYGAPAAASIVTLQALKAGALIIRGADGSVYFARQLSAGEAYRAPALAGLTADVSDPAAFQVFIAGQSKGLLPALQTPISKLGQ